MEGGHRYIEGLCVLTVVHSFRAKEWIFVDVWAWTYRHQWRSRDRCFFTHQPSLLYSALCRHHCREAALAEAYLHRERTLGWILWSGEGTRNLLQERGDRLVQEKLLGEGQAWTEARRPPTPIAHPSRASPAPSAGRNNAEPLPFARRDPGPPVLLPSPDSLHVFLSSATSAEGEKSKASSRHRRENNPYFWIPAFPWVSLYFSL